MELAGSDTPSPDHCRHCSTSEPSGGSENRRFRWHSGKTVDEIHPCIPIFDSEEWALSFNLQRRPSHMGDSLAGISWKTANMARQDSQASTASLITAFEQKLQSKTDSEQWTIVRDPVLQMRNKACRCQIRHSGVEGSDTGKNQGVNSDQIIPVSDRSGLLTESFH